MAEKKTVKKKTVAKKVIKKIAPVKAETKKVTKKVESKKKTETKKVAKEKNAVKETRIDADNKKISEVKKSNPKVSKKNNDKSKNWLIAAIVLGVLIVIGVVLLIVNMYDTDSNNSDNQYESVTERIDVMDVKVNLLNDFVDFYKDNISQDNLKTEIVELKSKLSNKEDVTKDFNELLKLLSNEKKISNEYAELVSQFKDIDKIFELEVELIIIEDKSCTNCNVDAFSTQVKSSLFPNTVVTKFSYDSEEGKKIVDELKLNEVPIFLFSKNIEESPLWEEQQLSQGFIAVKIDGKDFYMLNPQFIPTKVYIKDLKIDESAVVIGDKNAPLTISYFSDFECPYCAIAEGNSELAKLAFGERANTYTATMPKVFENYVKTGKVNVAFYNYPIASLHPKSKIMHIGAMCANEQDKFEEMFHKIWETRDDWSDSQISQTSISERINFLKSYAKELNLDMTKFDKCIDNQETETQVDAAIKFGQSRGIQGTPNFIIGRQVASGAIDYTDVEKIIESQLN